MRHFGNLSSMQELTWEQARKDLAKVNPKLTKIIDEINPSKEYTLFKVRYPYGSEILKNGYLYLPDKYGNLISICSPHADSRIKERLSYNLNSNPVSIVLKNSVELFLTLDDRTVQFYGLVPSGKIFGLWRILSNNVSHHPAFLWDMTAGTRSIFMLPKITETGAHNKIKKALQIDAEKPERLLDHWEVFKQIANSPINKDPWYTEILFFSKKWFENLDDKSWLRFNNFILQTAWQGSEFWRSAFTWDLVFSLIQKKKNIKPKSYIADTVKHLIATGVGAVPGFSPAIDNNAAPIDFIQKIYLEEYSLKDYSPIIMHPHMFNMYEKSRPVYYSLQFPTSLEFSLKSNKRVTTITDLCLVNSLLEKYIREILNDDMNLSSTPLYDLPYKVKYDFFHVGVQEYIKLRETENIPIEDETFVTKNCKNKKFPVTSSFVRGCIKISCQTKN